MTRATPAWIRRTTVGAVLTVAAVAAVISYCHMRGLALRAGEGGLADVLPLSVDGLLVAASLVLYWRRRAGLAVGCLPWSGLFLGVGASIAANIANAEPTALGRLVAAWPPLAFALSFELLVMVLRDIPAQGRPETGKAMVEASPEPAPVLVRAPALSPAQAAQLAAPAPPPPPPAWVVRPEPVVSTPEPAPAPARVVPEPRRPPAAKRPAPARGLSDEQKREKARQRAAAYRARKKAEAAQATTHSELNVAPRTPAERTRTAA